MVGKSVYRILYGVAILLLTAFDCFAQKTTISNLHQQAEQKFIEGNYTLALQLNMEAQQLADKMGDCKQKSYATYRVGRAYYYLQNKRETIVIFKQILKDLASCPNDSVLRKTLSGLGAIYHEIGVGDSALYYMHLAGKFIEKSGTDAEKSTHYGIMGEVYHAHKYSRSQIIPYFDKCRKYAFATNNPVTIGFAFMKIGHFYRFTFNYKMAIACYDSALMFYTKAKHIEGEMYALESIAFIASKINNAELAYSAMFNLKTKRDSIFKEKSAQELAAYRAKYQTEKKELELTAKTAELEKQKQKTIFTTIIGSVLLLLVFTAGAFIYYRAKIKAQLKIVQTKAHERNRIARELHDNVGSNVSFIVSKINQITENQNPNNELEHVKNAATDVMLNLRETLWTLNNTNLSNINLCDKLKVHVKKYLLIPHTITDKVEVEHQLSNEVVLAIYRCVQEILNNINKHSKATLVEVMFVANNNTKLMVQISDNGIGFVKTEKEESYGIRNLMSRMLEINATLEIQTQQGKGTSITITY